MFLHPLKVGDEEGRKDGGEKTDMIHPQNEGEEEKGGSGPGILAGREEAEQEQFAKENKVGETSADLWRDDVLSLVGAKAWIRTFHDPRSTCYRF